MGFPVTQTPISLTQTMIETIQAVSIVAALETFVVSRRDTHREKNLKILLLNTSAMFL